PPRDQRTPLAPQRARRRPLAPRDVPRRRLGGATGRRTHRLPRALHHSFPPVRQGLPDQAPGLLGAFRSRWPTRTAARGARRPPLEPFVRAHPVRPAPVMAPRLLPLHRALALPPISRLFPP